jgi:hypothetical protein
MNISTEFTIHDDYDHENPFTYLVTRQNQLEKKIDKIIDFLDNHEALMLQKINDFLSENRRLFMDTLNNIIDKENNSKFVVDKMNEFLTDNRKIYTELFNSVYTQCVKNTKQIENIKPLLDNINKTQEAISSLLKLTYSESNYF